MKESAKNVVRAERFSTRRMESLSDGVFGFAMTLLVLNIVVPTITSIRTDGQLWQALQSQQRGFISFVIAFFILAAMWSLHVRQFELLDKVDRRFLFINNVRLLLAILFPGFRLAPEVAEDQIRWALRDLLHVHFGTTGRIGRLRGCHR